MVDTIGLQLVREALTNDTFEKHVDEAWFWLDIVRKEEDSSRQIEMLKSLCSVYK